MRQRGVTVSSYRRLRQPWANNLRSPVSRAGNLFRRLTPRSPAEALWNAATTSRPGTLTIAGLTFTVTQTGTTGGGGTELITNPGFETGATPRIISSQVTRSTGAYPHSGTAYMIVNGVNNSTGTLYQTVTIPSGSAPSLNFWLNITTSEAMGAPVYDRLYIEVRNTSGTLLGTLATFTNQNSGTAGAYVLRGLYNLSSWAGQTVRIQFRGTNDVTLPTSFRVDDVSVK